jgi:hypothetical protein
VVLEAMRLTLGCKQKITRGKLHSIFPANKITIAGDNDIHLVAIVWDLRIGVGGAIPTCLYA